jgi:hypothetical protein
MMVDGRMAPPTSFAAREAVLAGHDGARDGRYEPNFDETVWKARNATRTNFASGTEGRNLTAINTAIGHLDSFDKAAQALNNGDYPLFNKMLNAAGPAGRGDEPRRAGPHLRAGEGSGFERAHARLPRRGGIVLGYREVGRDAERLRLARSAAQGRQGCGRPARVAHRRTVRAVPQGHEHEERHRRAEHGLPEGARDARAAEAGGTQVSAGKIGGTPRSPAASSSSASSSRCRSPRCSCPTAGSRGFEVPEGTTAAAGRGFRARADLRQGNPARLRRER